MVDTPLIVPFLPFTANLVVYLLIYCSEYVQKCDLEGLFVLFLFVLLMF